MNATNRPLGRITLVVVGLALLVAGLAAVLVQTVPQAADIWHDAARSSLGDLGTRASRSGSEAAWGWVLAGALVLGIVALIVLTRLGGGRVGTVIEDDGAPEGLPGEVRIDAAAVQHALSSAIGDLPQVASLAVDVYRVRGRRALRIRVRPRKGASPRAIADRVEDIVADLDALLGERLPVLLQIARGGSGSGRPDRVH